ncbi:MAG: Hpt domain-containing protein [Candidatus Magnetoglobus multicellularis str. Araruama]|uniref:Hpt domain-containing protein n=1 Tax=Candidatus Magnetoglobus multicellularis str. Araruama TaxID=890399 RepID=A0A1V1P689_9BACT|nr:MAG: Hpt domain-containing protein [Candidatus Magnetoglobus multicellularis str. Araruama]
MKYIVTVKNKIKRFIPQFLENTRNDLNLLKQAADNEDLPKVELLSHSMKGYGKPFGFEKFGNMAQDVNLAAKEQNLGEMLLSIQALDTYFSNIEIVYED